MSASRAMHIGAVITCAVSSVLAQGVTTDTPVHDVTIPGMDVDEGKKRYEPAQQIDWSNAVEVPMPTFNGALPDNFVNHAISYDVATGMETLTELPQPQGGLLVPGGSVAGQSMGMIVPEPSSAMSSQSAINSTAYPWRTQCRVFFSQGGSNFICSGTMIDPKNVITAGHCVHEGNGGAWSTNVRVAPNWDGDSDQYGESTAANVGSYTGWTVNGNLDHDHGHIRLNRPVGFVTGWLGYGWTSDDTFYTTNSLNWAAYPGCSSNCLCSFTDCPDQLYYAFGPADSVTSHRFNVNLTNFCSLGGMSGGGIYNINAGTSRVVYGVTSTQTWSACTVIRAGFTRIRQSNFDNLNNSYIPAGYGATLDLVPLDVNATANVSAGGRLDLLNFMAGNNSDADPANASYGFDVYLSTNDNISTADTLLGARSFTYDFAPRSSVRVNSTTNLPRIPADTTPGNYWIGVITEADANVGNNDTDGWDAAPITVDRKFPNLPTTALFVGSNGVHLTLDSGTLPNHAAINRLNGDTLAFDNEAWVNYGQLASPIDVFQGNRCIELGVNPAVASTSPDPIAALILRFNGLNGSDLVLDFMCRNFGEEVDECDGVWISADGNTWEEIIGQWDSTGGRWESIRDVQLTGATSVNTDNNFYLAFVVQDNFAFGGADGIAIDDIRIHPSSNGTMTISNFYSPGTGELHMTSSTEPFACFALSLTGGGPFPSPFGQVLLTPPTAVHACVLTSGGAADATISIPSGLVNVPIWWQGVEVGAAINVTNGVVIKIK